MTVTEFLNVDIAEAVSLRLHSDSHLSPFAESIRRRLIKVIKTENRITDGQIGLSDFASGHEYYGMHCRDGR